MDELAKRMKDVKFLRIVARECIPGYPDKLAFFTFHFICSYLIPHRNVPTTIIYHEKECQKQVIGLDALGGKRMNADGMLFPFTLTCAKL